MPDRAHAQTAKGLCIALLNTENDIINPVKLVFLNVMKYVAKAVPQKGWRIWNRKMKKWWGNFYKEYPQALLDELNGAKRPEKLVELSKS